MFCFFHFRIKVNNNQDSSSTCHLIFTSKGERGRQNRRYEVVKDKERNVTHLPNISECNWVVVDLL